MGETLERYESAIMNTYGRPMLVLSHGEGSYVWDEDGKKYLDLLGGIATNALGHNHPAWVAAVSKQAGTMAHASNFFATAPQIELAEKLLEIAEAPAGSRVFFCNSGTEANEAAIKLSRRTGRAKIVALEQSFHGRTMGALSVTHKPAIREPFAPLPGPVSFVAPGDVDALTAAVDGDTAAIMLEVIQGEAGVVPLTHEFVAAARRLADEHGALLIIDEVQTGIARTGRWFAHQAHAIVPDVMTLAKGLGGGFPIGAVVAFGERNGTLLTKGAHGTTFGGNPLACAAALATIGAIEDEDLIANAAAVGAHLSVTLGALPGVVGVNGAGLLLGIRLAGEWGADVTAAALAAGFIVNTPAPSVIRLAPALSLTVEQADTFVNWLRADLESRLAAAATEGEDA